MENKEVFVKRFFSFFSCYILIIAVVVWDGGGVFGKDCEGGTCGIDSTNDDKEDGESLEGFFSDIFDSNGLIKKDFSIRTSNDGMISFFSGEGDDIKVVEKVEIDEVIKRLKEISAFDVSEEGVLSFKVGDNEKREISLKNIPKDVSGISVSKDSKEITYIFGTDENAGKVVIGEDGVYLQESEGKVFVKGYKDSEINVNLGEMNGEINFLGEEITYKGKDTSLSLSDGSNEGYQFQSKEEEEGSLRLVEGGFVVRNSDVQKNADDSYRLTIGDSRLFIGSEDKKPDDVDNWLNYDVVKGPSLRGDLNALSEGESVSISVFGKTPISELSVDGILGEETKLEFEEEKNTVIFTKKDGKIEASVSKRTRISEPPIDIGDDESDEGDDLEGDDSDNSDDSDSTDIFPEDTDTRPPEGGFNWMTVLLIGGGIAGIIALLYLFGGGEDDEGEKEGRKEDEGERYIRPGTRENDSVDLPLNYNPGNSMDEDCFCNESGCFRCPDEDCFKC